MPQLLVDVSVIVRSDAGTGIQRVVRALLLQLLEAPPAGYEICPVRGSGWSAYRHAGLERALPGAARGRRRFGRGITVGPGDVFLGLDLATHALAGNHRQLREWKRRGAKLFFVVYDLLPVQHPDWFTAKAATAHTRWVHTLARFADGALCISQAVARELEQWLAVHGAGREIAIRWFHLAGDIAASAPTRGRPADFERDLERLRGGFVVLLAGTIEPRKGHAQVLSALEALWRTGADVKLALVGNPGWKSDDIIESLRRHPERGSRLFWFEAASDEVLCRLYEAADGVLVASAAEGFGLPIVEAARFGKPVLARDIAVFREIAGEGARYFTSSSAPGLAAEIRAWVDLVRSRRAPDAARIRRLSWRESAEQMLSALGLG
jgi:glycosyltransferase involved in cell wall biosynthesis